MLNSNRGSKGAGSASRVAEERDALVSAKTIQDEVNISKGTKILLVTLIKAGIKVTSASYHCEPDCDDEISLSNGWLITVEKEFSYPNCQVSLSTNQRGLRMWSITGAGKRSDVVAADILSMIDPKAGAALRADAQAKREAADLKRPHPPALIVPKPIELIYSEEVAAMYVSFANEYRREESRLYLQKNLVGTVLASGPERYLFLGMDPLTQRNRYRLLQASNGKVRNATLDWLKWLIRSNHPDPAISSPAPVPTPKEVPYTCYGCDDFVWVPISRARRIWSGDDPAMCGCGDELDTVDLFTLQQPAHRARAIRNGLLSSDGKRLLNAFGR